MRRPGGDRVAPDMRITIFGLSVSSTWGNGHGALWRGLIKALLRDGHRVDFYERDVPYYAANRDVTELPEGGRLVLYRDWPDILPDALEAEALLGDSPVPLRCLYDLDTPITLARLDAGEAVPYIGAGGLAGYD